MPASPEAESPRTKTPLWRAALSLALRLAGWACVLALAGLACAWTSGFDRGWTIKWVYAFLAYVFVPVYLVLGWAVISRQRWLAVAAACVVAWHVAVVGQEALPLPVPGHGPSAEAPSRQPIRVFYANVSVKNEEKEALFDEIRATAPDVVVLTEMSAGWHNGFNEGGLAVEYPHHIHLERYNPSATGVFSRYPIIEEQRFYKDRRVVVEAVIDADGAPLAVLAIHAPRPIDSPLHNFDGFWSLVGELLDAHDSRPDRSPLMLIGDFNATPFSLVYRELVGNWGLRDCHRLCGRGRATTWPNGHRLLPPIRIDHALVSGEVRCVAAAEGIGRGSDHKPLILDLSLPRRPGAPE
ncbi:MAG: endonuclease/exonuclease/phosphatase family protein [Planctomycetota bacterium]